MSLCENNLIVSQLVGESGVIDNKFHKSIIIRASKYMSSEGEIFFRVSATADSQCILFSDNIQSMTEAKKLFEIYQKDCFGFVKQVLKEGEFL